VPDAPDVPGAARSWQPSRDDATVVAYKLASAFARATPTAVAELSAPTLGLMFSQAMRGQRRMVERHQRRVHGHGLTKLQAIMLSQRAFESYAKYWIESFKLPNLSEAAVRRRFTIDGWEHVEVGLAAGKGVILSLPHLGNWEWAGRWLADKGIPLTVVVEPIHPPELFEWFRNLRTSFGMTVVPLGPTVATTVLGALKRNEAVCLMSDRDITGDGQHVTFFGEETTLPSGPATLALRTGAPLIPAAVYMGANASHFAWVRPPLTCERGSDGLRADIQRITQALANELELLIRRSPEQWHLLQPNWPSDPGYRS
jgi:phosphatidylinositol dimannoside acyltransferase